MFSFSLPDSLKYTLIVHKNIYFQSSREQVHPREGCVMRMNFTGGTFICNPCFVSFLQTNEVVVCWTNECSRWRCIGPAAGHTVDYKVHLRCVSAVYGKVPDKQVQTTLWTSKHATGTMKRISLVRRYFFEWDDSFYREIAYKVVDVSRKRYWRRRWNWNIRKCWNNDFYTLNKLL